MSVKIVKIKNYTNLFSELDLHLIGQLFSQSLNSQVLFIEQASRYC
jgi:hypothetical protein